VRPPGRLDELGSQGREAWDAQSAAALQTAVDDLAKDGKRPDSLTADPARTAELRIPDWPAFPARIGACLGAERALALLDWRPPEEGDLGRIRHQEEYLEWRLAREDQRVRRIEMTTEFPEYWQVLAAHEPKRILALVAAFARESEIPPEAVYGSLDPFDTAVTPSDRQAAFSQTMLPPKRGESREALKRVSRYNDGTSALCCMVQPSNTLGALFALVASAARPLLVRDSTTKRARFASGSEAINTLGAAGVDGRNSDPLVVERVTRLATERRPIGFDDPVGVYIRGVQRHELAQPDGTDVPESWFEFGRGVAAAEAPDGLQRRQRLILEAPPDADFALSDLVVRRTGERLRFGGQLAALVQLTLYVRTGTPEGPIETEPVVVADRPPADCQGENDSFDEMAEA
jgi:hypothetical protein